MKNKATFGATVSKKSWRKVFFSVLAFVVLGFLAPKVFAMTPSLSLNSTGNNSVQITVNGDSNSSVIFYYYPNGGGSVISTNIGSTNSSGYFSTTISNNTYNINQNSSVYVMVNGSQSNSVNWSYNNGGGNGNIYLSQSSLYLNSGQSVTDYIYGGANSYYISSNSNAGVASVSISGNTINVYGNYSGTANVNICSNNSSYGCVTLYINVNGNNNNYNQYPPISLSQSNVSVGVGQTINVGVSGGTGIYYISSNNSNQYIASVSMNNGSVSIYGRQIGSETVTICSSVANNYNNSNNGNNYSFNSCADIFINVGSGYSYNYNYVQPVNTGTYTSGVFLSQVPYTGSNTNTGSVLFVIALWIWSSAIAYFIFKKIESNSNVQVANSSGKMSHRDLIEKFKRENLARRGR